MNTTPISLQLVDQLINTTMASISKITSTVSPWVVDRKKVIRKADVSYGHLPEQVLDIYHPILDPTGKETKIPISILIHGGGFRYFSKNSHASIAGQLASANQLVFVLDYRLSPRHPFPAGLIDVITAYRWIVENAHKYGGDLQKISLIGESAGGNFALSLSLYLFGIQTLDSRHHLPPPPSFKPNHAVIHCGHLYVSNIERYREQPVGILVSRRIQQITRDYRPESVLQEEKNTALADPLLEMEKIASSGGKLPKGFPQIFVPVGDRDPVRGDSVRLAQALEILGQKNRLKFYPGEGHAFYVQPFSQNAKTCWQDIRQFLKTVEKTDQFAASQTEMQSEISS